jgi:hypothetical protein
MKYFIHLALISFLVQISSYAQDSFPLRGPAAERIEQFKKMRLMEAVQMNEETSIRFFNRYNKHTDNMRDIGKERNELVNQLEKLSKANAGEAESNKLIKDIGLIDEKLTEERARFIKELRDILTVNQIAQYVVFERNFNRKLLEQIREIAKERWSRRKE